MKLKEIIEMYQQEIDFIEEWTELQCKEIIFDSEYCNWNSVTSTFDKRIFKKECLLFLIETNDGIRFGGFVYQQI